MKSDRKIAQELLREEGLRDFNYSKRSWELMISAEKETTIFAVRKLKYALIELYEAIKK